MVNLRKLGLIKVARETDGSMWPAATRHGVGLSPDQQEELAFQREAGEMPYPDWINARRRRDNSAEAVVPIVLASRLLPPFPGKTAVLGATIYKATKALKGVQPQNWGEANMPLNGNVSPGMSATSPSVAERDGKYFVVPGGSSNGARDFYHSTKSKAEANAASSAVEKAIHKM